MSLLSKKTAVLRALVQRYEMSVSPAERELALATADALDAADEEISMLREQVKSVSEFSQEMSSDLAELEEALMEDEDEGEDEEEDAEAENSEEAEEEEEDSDMAEWEVDEGDLIEYRCPGCGTYLYFTPSAFGMEGGQNCPTCGRKLFMEDIKTSSPH